MPIFLCCIPSSLPSVSSISCLPIEPLSQPRRCFTSANGHHQTVVAQDGQHQKVLATNGHHQNVVALDGHHQNVFATNGHCSPGHLNDIICQLGPETDVATYASLLRRCSIEKTPSEGEHVHDLLIRRGYADNKLLNNLLIQMYGKCGSLEHARAVFDNMPVRNLYSWTIMLSACARNGHSKDALQLFGQMQVAGIEPDQITSICVLDACASLESLEEGRDIHASLVGNGWEVDVVVGTALVNMYGKCGSLDDARAMFAEMPQRNVVSWNAIITACVQNDHGKEALQLFDQMQADGFELTKITSICVLDACARVAALEGGQHIHAIIVGNGWESDVVVGTALVNMYGKCQSLDDSKVLFAEMTRRDVVLWCAMIAAYVLNEQGKDALHVFDQMQAEGFKPNKIISVCVLDACASIASIEEGQEMHASVVCNGWESDSIVANALINMYGKCDSLDDAQAVFAEMPQKNVVSWNAMIAACAQNGHDKEALQLFGRMQTEGFEPDNVTFLCGLDACANVAALEEGQGIHAVIVGNGCESDVLVGTALVNMYGKCGCLDDAKVVFAETAWRDVVLWSAMMAVSAQNGQFKEALQLFAQMQAEGHKPDKVTFICVLTACSHLGMVVDGRQFFTSMSQDHGILPSVEHYVCMIDILGRAGQLDKAEQLINSMPFEPISSAWLSLLSACRIHSDVERAVRAANYVIALDENKASPYVLLANIHAVAGRGADEEKVRKAMIDKGVKKVPGRSCIEVKNVVHEFVSGDAAHPQWEQISAELQKLRTQMEEEYVPNSNLGFSDLDEEPQEHMLCYHSEKVAIVFGLISTPPGTPVRITKNLRVCSDCHSMSKFISKVAKRKIIVRDTNCLHHIEKGVCSCGEYW